MNKFDKTESRLPSFETKWLNHAEAEEQEDEVSASSWPEEQFGLKKPEATPKEIWRGYSHYDSPLAG